MSSKVASTLSIVITDGRPKVLALLSDSSILICIMKVLLAVSKIVEKIPPPLGFNPLTPPSGTDICDPVAPAKFQLPV